VVARFDFGQVMVLVVDVRLLESIVEIWCAQVVVQPTQTVAKIRAHRQVAAMKRGGQIVPS